ncbi:Retrovirus-related Pol polyprotein from transposon TNT 1-94 [Vitis vinifera]|uniref:Retrovirus-related Pol polyprotein from transposon TNT 1-94 n=1 Tax=Vitis vinifera TaxID=29760 RepID=A0A438ERC8_VITVI|nr:Retrovirus-related Pol polyprotein from transposon TNT 1-94 [Vitis vinifera]
MVVRQRSTILRQALILISQPSNALTAIRPIPPVWISHNFKATTLGMTRKTMRNRCFDPWTFRSCLGYHHFVINDNNRDQRKKDFKKTSIATVAEIKTKANVAEKASVMVAATDHGGKFLNTFTPVINSAWIIDSSATDHMTFDSRQVSPLRSFSQKIVSTANGNTTPIIGERSLTLTDTLNFDSVLVVPSLNYNLLSISQITAALSCIVIFWPEFCVIKDIQTRQTIGCGIKQGKLYYLDLQSKDSNKLQQALMADGYEGEKKKSEIWLWHRHLRHASFGYLKKLFSSLFAKSDISGFRCDICELAKSHRVSFPLILNKSPLPFMVIHFDVWGPSKVPTLSGSRWFVTFIDDCTRMTWLYLMKTKDEVNLLFQNFHKMIETQYNAKVWVLRSDNGGEYQSSDLQKYLEEHGIIHQTTCSNTPQQNGVVERKNQHLLEVVRASLIAAKHRHPIGKKQSHLPHT